MRLGRTVLVAAFLLAAAAAAAASPAVGALATYRAEAERRVGEIPSPGSPARLRRERAQLARSAAALDGFTGSGGAADLAALRAAGRALAASRTGDAAVLSSASDAVTCLLEDAEARIALVTETAAVLADARRRGKALVLLGVAQDILSGARTTSPSDPARALAALAKAEAKVRKATTLAGGSLALPGVPADLSVVPVDGRGTFLLRNLSPTSIDVTLVEFHVLVRFGDNGLRLYRLSHKKLAQRFFGNPPAATVAPGADYDASVATLRGWLRAEAEKRGYGSVASFVGAARIEIAGRPAFVVPVKGY